MPERKKPWVSGALHSALYFAAFLAWPAVWYAAGGFDLIRGEPWLWGPFGLGMFVNIANFCILAIHGYMEDGSIVLAQEEEVVMIEFVERHTAHVVAAIAGVFLVARLLTGGDTKVPSEFVSLEFWALIIAVGAVFPLYWGPWPGLLAAIRHVKAVALSYSICLFLAGVILLWPTVEKVLETAKPLLE
ncbi:MAG: hypothetical protein AAGF92_14970 [Myxococcota bacterium]